MSTQQEEIEDNKVYTISLIYYDTNPENEQKIIKRDVETHETILSNAIAIAEKYKTKKDVKEIIIFCPYPQKVWSWLRLKQECNIEKDIIKEDEDTEQEQREIIDRANYIKNIGTFLGSLTIVSLFVWLYHQK